MSISSALHGAGSTLYSNLFVTLPLPAANPQLADQTFIATGANTGLGLESCRHLVKIGVGRLIMAVRSESKGKAAREELLSETDVKTSIEVWPIDMEDYESIKMFASRASQLSRIDGVLANAGILTNTWSTNQGNEKTLTVNIIGTFLLYLLLLPAMKESGRRTGNICRFTIPNSALHYLAPTAELEPKSQTIMDRLNDPKQANMAGRYNLSKLLVIYAVREFADRAARDGAPSVIINTPNPSFCRSNLVNGAQRSTGFAIGERLFARSTEEGSRALVHGLLAGPESSGQYLTNCHVQRPSKEVTGTWGQKVQKRFFAELVEKLDAISPGGKEDVGL
ncbi:hypothetical protein B0I35DRAFT_162977 [Stachybotrys elegans]|uniref:Uncharacterized protein n=1 Tax=Stachybotrys elegans TaxID=80388 RepID=A0A8K0SYZ3_9HYPO|nr:hypothetical protein B0I35DRAFT_162977 [Stachybotrys elegans]